MWDANRSIPVVLQDGTNSYLYGHGLISATAASGAQTYFLADGLGSTYALTDSTSTVTGTYRYDAFGSLLLGAGRPRRSSGSRASRRTRRWGILCGGPRTTIRGWSGSSVMFGHRLENGALLHMAFQAADRRSPTVTAKPPSITAARNRQQTTCRRGRIP